MTTYTPFFHLLPVKLMAFGLASAPASASGEPTDHINPPQLLMVEHAEILIPGPNGNAEGYLTIWNGTTNHASIASITSDAFDEVVVLKSRFLSDSAQSEPVEGIVPIPGHAELKMRGDGIRLALRNPVSPTVQMKSAGLTLIFDDGTELEVQASIHRSSEMLTDHHHGEVDRRSN
ncbi:MAG: copper chaperone PCu(A)C [Alphaproteobacteria bacterium]|nr:copper chaperone PCu(A)C [Alphaproteobacteria bacterium]MBU2191557.1 copper chaperone PCu(A)C [Alphaproteobacteria bacterium]